MRVLRTPGEIKSEEARIARARAGCDICPCCGETRSWGIGDDNKAYGILLNGYTVEEKGFFNIKSLRRDQYTCYTCKAEFESDPYEI